MRRPIVAGNWKMNMAVGEAIDLAAEVKRLLVEFDGAEVVVCPPFTALKPVGDLIRYGVVELGAQDVHWEPNGPCTGEISTAMLRDLACVYCIVGHSERRARFGETDDGVNRKAKALLAAGIRPIVCVGETLEQRDAGRTGDVVRSQVLGGLAGIDRGFGDVVIAYEPVWAIGTGRTATPEQAQEVHRAIRGLVAELAGDAAAAAVRIQYGGSVNASNARAIFSRPDVDGGLIGGASLDAGSFVAVVRAAAPEQP